MNTSLGASLGYWFLATCRAGTLVRTSLHRGCDKTQTARNRHVGTCPMRAVRDECPLQRFLRVLAFGAALAAAPFFSAARRGARASLTAALGADTALLRRAPGAAAPPSTAGNERTRAPPLSLEPLSASDPRAAGGLIGVSRTSRKSILRASRSTRLTC